MFGAIAAWPMAMPTEPSIRGMCGLKRLAGHAGL